MSNLNNTAANVIETTANPMRLLASPRHTMTLFGIVLILLVTGVLNASTNFTANQVFDSSRMVKNDLIMIGMLWFWVFFVYRGMKDHGHSILQFFGFQSCTSTKLFGDFVCATLAFALIYACETGVKYWLPEHASQANNPLFSARLSGLFEVVVWLCLSASAGICEEIVFRGYLQRQLALITGNTAFAILLQAFLFGIGHAYEGLSAVVAIVLHGLFLGILAQWRGNIRAGILEHAGWDIVAGLGLIGANW